MPVGVFFHASTAPLEFWFYWAFVLLATLPYPPSSIYFLSTHLGLINVSLFKISSRTGVWTNTSRAIGQAKRTALFDCLLENLFSSLTFNVLVVAAHVRALTRVTIYLLDPGRLETIIQSHAPATIFAGFAGDISQFI